MSALPLIPLFRFFATTHQSEKNLLSALLSNCENLNSPWNSPKQKFPPRPLLPAQSAAPVWGNKKPKWINFLSRPIYSNKTSLWESGNGWRTAVQWSNAPVAVSLTKLVITMWFLPIRSDFSTIAAQIIFSFVQANFNLISAIWTTSTCLQTAMKWSEENG